MDLRNPKKQNGHETINKYFTQEEVIELVLHEIGEKNSLCVGHNIRANTIGLRHKNTVMPRNGYLPAVRTFLGRITYY